MTPEELTAEYGRMAADGADYTPSPEYARETYATADFIYVDHRREQFDRMLNGVRAAALRDFAQFVERWHRPGPTSRATILADLEYFATIHEPPTPERNPR